jgi:hypothetical protein
MVNAPITRIAIPRTKVDGPTNGAVDLRVRSMSDAPHRDNPNAELSFIDDVPMKSSVESPIRIAGPRTSAKHTANINPAQRRARIGKIRLVFGRVTGEEVRSWLRLIKPVCKRRNLGVEKSSSRPAVT